MRPKKLKRMMTYCKHSITKAALNITKLIRRRKKMVRWWRVNLSDLGSIQTSTITSTCTSCCWWWWRWHFFFNLSKTRMWFFSWYDIFLIWYLKGLMDSLTDRWCFICTRMFLYTFFILKLIFFNKWVKSEEGWFTD